MSTEVAMSRHPRPFPPNPLRDRAKPFHAPVVGVCLAIFLAGCHDTTSPVDRLAPTAAQPVLVGATVVNLLDGQEPGTQVDVRGLNDAGQATGSRFVSGGDWRPYRWTPGTGFQAIAVFPGTAWGSDINNAGVVVGRMQVAQNIGDHAFVAAANIGTDLGVLPGVSLETAISEAFAINDAGEIVGRASTSANPPYQHAVYWSAAHVIQDLGTLGGNTSVAVDINASGQVIGMSDVTGGGRHGVLWTSGGGMQDLSTLLGSPASGVAAINDAGQIAGSYVAPGGETHAFLYTPGSGLRDLGTLGGNESVATGLNAQGDVVGSSKTGTGATHAFFWSSSDGMEDVTDVTSFSSVRKLNDDLQTLSGEVFPSGPAPISAFIITLELGQPWPFSGFANPIKDAPAWNAVTAGSEVIVRFGLGGDRGLGIFAPGSPSTTPVSCATGAAIGSASAISASDFELRYQKGPDRYMLRWSTDRAWSRSCRQLTLVLDDGSTHVALFSFR
jgi:probable HAF family extracellular repeat protein